MTRLAERNESRRIFAHLCESTPAHPVMAREAMNRQALDARSRGEHVKARVFAGIAALYWRRMCNATLS